MLVVFDYDVKVYRLLAGKNREWVVDGNGG